MRASSSSAVVEQLTYDLKFKGTNLEAVFLVVCDPSINEL
jgi:hypothetical protein